jgi:hypothetical protein
MLFLKQIYKYYKFVAMWVDLCVCVYNFGIDTFFIKGIITL